MASSSQSLPVLILRSLIGIAFLGALGLVGLYLFGIAGTETEVEPKPASRPSDDFQVLGEGFHFALNEGDRTVFEIEGSQQRSDRKGLVFLQNVMILVDRDEGRYRISAETAEYNPENHKATLRGGVELEGPESRKLHAEVLDIDGTGEQMFAPEGARFSSGSSLRGRSDYLEVVMEQERYLLRGGVVLQGDGKGEEPRFRLESDELVLNHSKGLGEATGNVIVKTDTAKLIGQRLYLTLDPESGEPTLLRLQLGVNVELSPKAVDPSITTVSRMTGLSLRLELDPATGDPTSLLLKGLPKTPARFRQEIATGELRTVVATQISVEFLKGVPRSADLSGPVLMQNNRVGDRPDEARNASGNDANLTFDRNGEVSTFRLVGRVNLRDGEIRGEGREAVFEQNLEGFEITGTPARVTSPSGEIEALYLRYATDIDVLQAENEVLATFDEQKGKKGKASQPSMGFGSSDQPMRVQSEAATFRSGGDLAHFEGNVRAWQGDATILADTLTGDQARGRLTASGGVRTLWTPPPPTAEELEKAAREAASEDPDDETVLRKRNPQGRMSVIAGQMIYEEGAGHLAYSGGVRADQDGSSLRCDRMNLALDEKSKAREMICMDNVDIDDSINQIALKGDRAIYDLENGMVEVFGNPVEMTDGTGAKVGGAHRLDYSFDAGSVYMVSAPNEEVLVGEAAGPGIRGAVFSGPGKDSPGDQTVPLTTAEREAREAAAAALMEEGTDNSETQAPQTAPEPQP